MFDSVDEGGDILFFDEADVLFGKRTEVKVSRDRYVVTSNSSMVT